GPRRGRPWPSRTADARPQRRRRGAARTTRAPAWPSSSPGPTAARATPSRRRPTEPRPARTPGPGRLACARSVRSPAALPTQTVERRRPAHRRVVRPQPLDDLVAVAVRVGDEEAVAVGDRRRLLGGDVMLAEMGPGGLGVLDAECKMAWAERVCLGLEQQMQLLATEFEPQHAEVERPRLGDLLQPEHVAVEVAAAAEVG